MTPPPLPPPPDVDWLAREFPVVDKRFLPSTVFRVHQERHAPEWFATGSSRFDPPEGVTTFGTCYAALDPVTAVMEVVGDLDVVTQSFLDRRAMALLQMPVGVRLADMASPAISGFGLDRRISVGDDYDSCQAWAQALWLAGFGGIFYEPRHDPNLGARSFALFGDPGHQPTQVRLVSDDPINATLLARVRRDYGLVVA